MVIEREGNRERAMDIGSRLLKDRIIKVSGPVNDAMADIVTDCLLFLESEDPAADIYMYINSPGGMVTAGMAIYDVMQYIRPDVCTIVNGLAASMGSMLLMGGAKGKRWATPNAEIMVHQPSGGAQGKASDCEISLEHLLSTKERLHKICCHHTGQSIEAVKAAFDRDKWMTPQEAQDFGIIDKVIYKH